MAGNFFSELYPSASPSVNPESTQTPSSSGSGGFFSDLYPAKGFFSELYSGGSPKAASAVPRTISPETAKWDESKDVFSNLANQFTTHVSDIWHDSSSSTLGKLWDMVNVPLISSDAFERLGNLIAGDSEIPDWERGIGRGVASLISGLTSPLSAGMALGTFGTSSLESGGAAFLSKMGFESGDIAQIAKGLPEVMKGRSIGRIASEIAPKLTQMGLNPDTVFAGAKALEETGMHADSLLQNHIVRRVASSMLRGTSLGETSEGIITAEKGARLAQIATDLGFTAPMTYGALVTSPRINDAVKDGEWGRVAELLTETVGQGAFAFLGARATLAESRGLLQDIGSRAKLYSKPSEMNLMTVRSFSQADYEKELAERNAQDYVVASKTEHPDWTEQQHLTAVMHRLTGGDDTQKAYWSGVISRAAGRSAPEGSPSLEAEASTDLHDAFATAHPNVHPGLISSVLAAATPGHSPEEAVRFADNALAKYEETGRFLPENIDVERMANQELEDYAKKKREEFDRRVANGETPQDIKWNDSRSPVRSHTAKGITYQSKRLDDDSISVRAVDEKGKTLAETTIAPESDKEAFTTGMSVPEQYRGRGLAKELYKQLPAIAKAYGIEKLSGEGVQTPEGAAVWKSLEKSGHAKPIDIFGETRLGMLTEGAPDVHTVSEPKSIARRYAMENLQKVLDHVGDDEQKAAEWLSSDHPIDEVRAVRGRGHLPGAADAEVPGAMALGNTVGKRFLNIHNGLSDEHTQAAKEYFAPVPKPTGVPSTQYHGGEWQIIKGSEPTLDQVAEQTRAIKGVKNTIQNDIAHSLPNSLRAVYRHMKNDGDTFTQALARNDVQNGADLARLFGTEVELKPAVNAPQEEPFEDTPDHPLRSKKIGGVKWVSPQEYLDSVGGKTPLTKQDSEYVDQLAEKMKSDSKTWSQDQFKVAFGSVSGDIIGHSYNDRLAALAAIKAGIDQVPVVTAMFDPTMRWDIPLQDMRVDVDKANLEMSKARIKSLIDKHSLAEKPKEYVDSLLEALDPKNATEEIQDWARKHGDYFDQTLEMGQRGDVLEHGVRSYLTGFWKDDKLENPAENLFNHELRDGRFAVNTAMARHKEFQNALEGILLGKELKYTNLADMAAYNRLQFSKVISNRNAINRLRDYYGSDGMPMVAPDGMAEYVEGDHGENPSIFANPKTMNDIRISKARLANLQKTGQLDRMIDQGKIIVHNKMMTLADLDERMELLRKNREILQRDNPDPTPEARAKIQAMTERYRMMESIKKAGTSEARDSALDEYNDKYKPTYLWNSKNYKVIDTPSMHNWRWTMTDPLGQSVIMKTNMRVHPEAFEYLNRRLGMDKGWENPIAKAALRTATETKGILLSVDTFHLFQEAMRGLMSGVMPWGVQKPDLYDPRVMYTVMGGANFGKPTGSMEGFIDAQEGHAHSKLMQKIPLLGNQISRFQGFLFDNYIPSLKARSAIQLFDRAKALYPDMSPEEIGRITAREVNNRFGGQNYERMGRALSTENFLRIVALAPDWLESELKFYGSLAGEHGGLARRDMAYTALCLWGVARVLNQLSTGNMHFEAPFSLAAKDEDGREKLYSIRTLPTDLMHLASDPINFMKGRVSPIGRTFQQWYTATDEFGRKLPSHGRSIDLLNSTLMNMSPIPIQQGIKGMLGEMPSGVTEPDQLMKSLGTTVTPYKSVATQKAAELASDRTPGGPVDPLKVRQHQFMIDMEDRLRAGLATNDDLKRLYDSGQITHAQGKEIADNVKATQGMEADTAKLVSRATRLPMSDFLEVFDLGTNTEKTALFPELQKKVKAYLKKVDREYSPEQRAEDKTFREIRRRFPNELGF